MEKLITELLRLYIPAGAVTPERLARHIRGQEALPAPRDSADSPDAPTRAIAIPFDRTADDGEAGHWTRLCAAASELQAGHGFPAPAVSVDGIHGYCLWISLETPVPAAEARQFAALARAAWSPGAAPGDGAAGRTPRLPPCLTEGAGKWAAFIHPGMGASFADEPWLDVAPPPLAQAAFLEGLESVDLARFREALQALRPLQPPSPPAARATQAAACAAPAEGLLLRDATLEDIVRHLHAKNIEPTFRHLVPGSR